MKKVLSVCFAVILAASVCLTAIAAPGGFVSSPSGNKAPELVDYKLGDAACTAKLIITAYADRETLPQETIDVVEAAYKEIVNTVDLSKLNAGVADIAKEKEIPVQRLAVSDMFDISSFGCDDHDGHNFFDVTLKPDSLEHFVCLLYYYNGEWEIIEGATVEGEHLVFDVEAFSPFAIVVDGGEEHVIPPQTGDDSGVTLYIYIAIMAVSLIALIVLLRKSKKKSA